MHYNRGLRPVELNIKACGPKDIKIIFKETLFPAWLALLCKQNSFLNVSSEYVSQHHLVNNNFEMTNPNASVQSYLFVYSVQPIALLCIPDLHLLSHLIDLLYFDTTKPKTVVILLLLSKTQQHFNIRTVRIIITRLSHQRSVQK